MNKFCYGQIVIDVLTRKSHIVSALRGNGVIVVDTSREAMESDFQILVDYLDPTNYFYHHSKFGDGQQLANEAFCDYMSALDEMKDLCSYPGESVFLMRARTMCQTWIDEAAAKIEQGLAMKRTAEHNLAQWDGLTLDYHKPFLNPENVINY